VDTRGSVPRGKTAGFKNVWSFTPLSIRLNSVVVKHKASFIIMYYYHFLKLSAVAMLLRRVCYGRLVTVHLRKTTKFLVMESNPSSTTTP
jgi:hypothetical protein